MAGRGRVLAVALGWGTLGALALVVRVNGLHQGLIYPDGYQYLLMARGIAEHLTPTLRLGPGGALFVPSADAALKPLFPALVALLSAVTGVRAGADALTAVSGAATVVLVGLIAWRLTGSLAAGAVASAAALVSPALAFWSGFAGPDATAQALALATVLAVIERRGKLAGTLGALCGATRPEWLLVFVGVAAAGLAWPSARAVSRQALIAGAFVLAAILALLRPPLALPTGGIALLVGALGASTALQLGAGWAAAARRRALAAAVTMLALLAAIAVSGRSAALNQLLAGEWPLLALAAFGVVRACWSGNARPALILLGAVAVLGAAYTYRNAGSERYLAQLVPLACVACGFAAAPVASLSASARSLRLAVPVVALALVLIIAVPRPALANDTFAALAGKLNDAPPGPLISAAPDAYGYLLPGRPQEPIKPGARGLILLDGAQRTYAPGLTAQGVVVATLVAPHGFERPNGTVDLGPALLVRGVVVDERPS